MELLNEDAQLDGRSWRMGQPGYRTFKAGVTRTKTEY